MSLTVKSRILALHDFSKHEISEIRRMRQTGSIRSPLGWYVEGRPQTVYQQAASNGEEPVIPATTLFSSLTAPCAETDCGRPHGLPTVGECATHLELLEVFFRVRSQVIKSHELDRTFGLRHEHRIVYQKQFWNRKKQPVRLADPKWPEKRRKKWGYFLSIAVARFQTWAFRALDLVSGSGADLQLKFLPPLDILMVWHAFLLNPRSFGEYCRANNIGGLREVPFPWLEIHKAIDTSNWTYILSSPAASWYQDTFKLEPDLLQYLAERGYEQSVSPIAQALSGFGAETITYASLSAFLEADPPLETGTRDWAFLSQLYNSQRLRLQLAPLSANVQRQATFVDKMHRYLWIRAPSVEGTLRRAQVRYGQFLRLFALYPGAVLVPTLDIDLAWHTHQLSAVVYERDMLKRAGRFIDHDDKVNKSVLADGMRKMKDLWRVRFGCEYELCLCWDCEALVDALEGEAENENETESEEEEEGKEEPDEIEKVVEKVRSDVEYYRAVEVVRRAGNFRLPVRLKEAEK